MIEKRNLVSLQNPAYPPLLLFLALHLHQSYTQQKKVFMIGNMESGMRILYAELNSLLQRRTNLLSNSDSFASDELQKQIALIIGQMNTTASVMRQNLSYLTGTQKTAWESRITYLANQFFQT